MKQTQFHRGLMGGWRRERRDVRFLQHETTIHIKLHEYFMIYSTKTSVDYQIKDISDSTSDLKEPHKLYGYIHNKV